MGELELLGVTLEGVYVLQHHHQVVGLQLIVPHQGDGNPPPQQLAVTVQVTLFLGEGGTLATSELFIAGDAAQPVFRMIELGGVAMNQLLLAVAQHLFDGRIGPEDLAVQIELADPHRGVGHHGVQKIVVLGLGRRRLLQHQRQFAPGQRSQQAQQAHHLVHVGERPLEQQAADAHRLPLRTLEGDAGIGLDLPGLQHGGVGEQLLYPIAEPGLALLQGDLPQGGADRKTEAGRIERDRIGCMHLAGEPRLIPTRNQDEVGPDRCCDFTHKGIEISLTTRMRQT